MIDMKFSEEELHGIWSMTAAALLLGELEVDDSKWNSNSKPEDGKTCKIKNKAAGELVADLL